MLLCVCACVYVHMLKCEMCSGHVMWAVVMGVCGSLSVCLYVDREEAEGLASLSPFLLLERHRQA